jgi:uncharacterized protein (TIGR03067 family)
MLKRFLMAAAACAALAAYATHAQNNQAKDEAKLEGTWKYTSYTRGGTTIGKDKVNSALTFKDGKYTRQGINFPGKTGTYKIDTSKKPMEFTFVPDDGPSKGKQILGIIEVSGDKLKICANAEKRPAQFDGSDKMTFLLEAVRDK